MSMPLWVGELAESFWERAGEREPFPRALRRAVARALPLTVVALPRLRLAGIEAWLARQGVSCAIDAADRPLRACLVARRGHGLIFLDGADPEDEQRFSLAHEVAHFLRDYCYPRQQVCRRLGPAALDVLDGLRPPEPSERVHALLAKVTVEAHHHLMERTPDGHPVDAEIDASERDADRLAFELLAPFASVHPEVQRLGYTSQSGPLIDVLQSAYGLPDWPARQYAAQLAPRATEGSSLVSRLWSRA